MTQVDTAKISPKAYALLRELERATNQMWEINARTVSIEKAYADREAARNAVWAYIAELEGVEDAPLSA